jgi:hypothetical protein
LDETQVERRTRLLGRASGTSARIAGHGLAIAGMDALGSPTHQKSDGRPIWVASPFMWKKKNGAFFRLVKCTTSRPPWQAATGGTRREKAYQQIGRSA